MNLPRVTKTNVALDTETSGLYVDDGARVSIVSCAWRNEQGVLVSEAWPFDQGAGGKMNEDVSLFEQNVNLQPADWVELCVWVGQQRLIMHNAYFDVQIMNAGHRVYEAGVNLNDAVVWDTKLGQWVLDPLESTSLKPTAARLWGEDEKAEQEAMQPWLKKTHNRFDLVPWEIVAPYAVKDAELTLRLFEYQQERLEEEPELAAIIERELAVQRVLIKMAYRGIGYDVGRSKVEGAKAKALLRKLDRELPFQPATPAKARSWFFNTCNALPHCKTAGGDSSVAECCVRSLIAQQVQGAEIWQRRQKVAHAISKYYDGYADATGSDGRLRSDFNQAGTTTMRFSSRRVNLQAIPQDYRLDLVEGVVTPRSLFRAKEGYELWEFDLSQAEARVAAKLAGCESWLEMFRDGRDFHSETADRLFGSHDKERRQVAKRANFALIYGVGPATFRADVEKHTGVILTDQQARDVVYGWRDLYPEFPRINKRAEQIATRRRHVKLVDGRLRWFTQYDELHKAFNAVIQGSIGQFVKRWMVYADWPGEVEVLLQIHDSLVCELRADDERREGRVAMVIGEGGVMASGFFDVPMRVEANRWESAGKSAEDGTVRATKQYEARRIS